MTDDSNRGTAHKSPVGGDQREHVTVKGDNGAGTMHVYDDGTATRKDNNGNIIHFRRDLAEDDLLDW